MQNCTIKTAHVLKPFNHESGNAGKTKPRNIKDSLKAAPQNKSFLLLGIQFTSKKTYTDILLQISINAGNLQ